jgi:hypothetical protein
MKTCTYKAWVETTTCLAKVVETGTVYFVANFCHKLDKFFHNSL